MSALEAEDEALVAGQWVVVRGIRRWRPALELVSDLPAAPDLTKLIACPTCHAVVTECCTTRSGHRTTAHGSRLVPRLCPCGELPGWNRRYCPPCAAENERRSKRAYNNRVRRESA